MFKKVSADKAQTFLIAPQAPLREHDPRSCSNIHRTLLPTTSTEGALPALPGSDCANVCTMQRAIGQPISYAISAPKPAP